jgi:ABC-type multidrug transport system permease subunit
MLLGFRFTGGIDGALAGMLIVFLFGMTMCWPMAFIGIMAKTTESVNTLGFMIILPLTFASSAFAPPASMPPVLRTFVEWNPITAVIDATRGLMLGLPTGSSIQRAILWMIGITAVFAPLAVARYRKRT